MLRRISLATITDSPANGQGQVIYDYARMLEEVLCTASARGGLTTAQMRRAFQVLDKVQQAQAAGRAFVLVTEDDYGFVQQRLEAFEWALANRHTRAFVAAIDEAVRVDPNAPPAEDPEAGRSTIEVIPAQTGSAA
jgi:hypothetical protein